jgi:Na+/proline symporter
MTGIDENRSPQINDQTSVIAVLAAAIGGAITTASTEGSYGIISLIVGLISLSVLLTYGLSLYKKLRWTETLTFGMIFGFCLFLVMAPIFLEKAVPDAKDTNIPTLQTLLWWIVLSVIGGILRNVLQGWSSKRSSNQS